MNTKIYFIAKLASVAALAGSLAVTEAKEPALAAGKIRQELTSVPKPELPAKAAKLVLSASGKDRTQATEAIVTAAVDLNPVAAPMIVGSVCKLSPDMASAAAVAAAARQPKQTGAIATSAATAAPEQALQIVAAMCKGQPGEYRTIAVAVAGVVSQMDKAILDSVIEAIPTLRPFYVRASAAFAKSTTTAPTVSVYLEQVVRDVEHFAKASKIPVEQALAQGIAASQESLMASPPPLVAPVVRPPFTGLVGTPGEINRNQTGEIPPGGPRNYSAP